jgi:hypothetical protein
MNLTRVTKMHRSSRYLLAAMKYHFALYFVKYTAPRKNISKKSWRPSWDLYYLIHKLITVLCDDLFWGKSILNSSYGQGMGGCVLQLRLTLQIPTTCDIKPRYQISMKSIGLFSILNTRTDRRTWRQNRRMHSIMSSFETFLFKNEHDGYIEMEGHTRLFIVSSF